MESPDFEQKALNILDAISVCASPSLVRPEVQTKALAQIVIAEQLRLVWNARGAADLDAMETAHKDYNWTELEDGIRSLDR
jgi:hypothetical protein